MITPELIAAGGILGALAIAVFRLLQADPPLARAVQTAERREHEAGAESDLLKRENERLREELSEVRTELAVARAWARFNGHDLLPNGIDEERMRDDS